MFLSSLLLGSCALSQLGTHASNSILEEPDYALAADALPSLIKIAETMQRTYPDKTSYRITLASLYLLYANAFLEGEAFYLMDTDYAAARGLQLRAKSLYVRAAALLEPAILKKSPRLLASEIQLDSSLEPDSPAFKNLTGGFKADSVDLLYYYSAASLAAFALDPLDFENAQKVPAAILLLQRAMELDPLFNGGMVRELAFTVYTSLPESLGGNRKLAQQLYETIADDQINPASAAFYVSWALGFCAPENEYADFINSLEKAIAIGTNPDRPSLMNSLAARKAGWILENSFLYIDEPAAR